MAYNEIEQRGTSDFPFAFYHLDFNHSRYHMSAHWHGEMELIRVLDGEFHVTLNNKRIVAKTGDIVLVNKEVLHQGSPFNCEYECIVFHAEFLYSELHDSNGLIKGILDQEYVIVDYYPHTNSELNRIFDSIFDAIRAQQPGYKFRIIAAFYNLFAIIQEQQLYTRNIGSDQMPGNRNIAKLKKILAYIRSNYDKPITLDMIAKTVDMSPKYLGSFFKNMTKITPFEYLNEYRIEKACQKLRNTDMSVTDIAYTCGFSDLSYFIKTFKNRKGVSPGKFRSR